MFKKTILSLIALASVVAVGHGAWADPDDHRGDDHHDDHHDVHPGDDHHGGDIHGGSRHGSHPEIGHHDGDWRYGFKGHRTRVLDKVRWEDFRAGWRHGFFHDHAVAWRGHDLWCGDHLLLSADVVDQICAQQHVSPDQIEVVDSDDADYASVFVHRGDSFDYVMDVGIDFHF